MNPPPFTSRLSLLAVLVMSVALFACGPTSVDGGGGGGGNGDPVDADLGPRSDGSPGQPDAQDEPLEEVECPPGLPSDFGDLGFTTTTKNFISDSSNVFARLQGNERWFFVINLYPDRGIFSEMGIAPGTYVLGGSDLDYQYCAACIILFADEDEEEGGPSLHMMPTQATLVIDSVTQDNNGNPIISGSVEEVALRTIKITYDGDTCNDIEDPICVNTICLGNECGQQTPQPGCTTAIGRMSF